MQDNRELPKRISRRQLTVVISGATLIILATAFLYYIFLTPEKHISILSIAGNVEYSSPGSEVWENVELEQVLSEGDSIRTAADSGVYILIDGRINMKLGPGSLAYIGQPADSTSSRNKPVVLIASTDPDIANELSKGALNETNDEGTDELPPAIESDVAADIAANEDIRINLDMGQAIFELKKNKLISDSADYAFTVRTPTAYAGVRGTEFFTRVTTGDDPQYSGVGEFFTLEGTIYMASASGADLSLSQGEAFFADPRRDSNDTEIDSFSLYKMRRSIYAWSDQLKAGSVLEKLNMASGETCPEGMVLIPSGYITDRGSNLAFSDTGRKFMDSYCIDIYEYPNQKGTEPILLSSTDAYERADYYCTEAGKRVCKAQEWERACRGSAMRYYPYGDRYREDVCNINTGSIHISGSHPECKSDFGVYDMVGNAWEITATLYGDPITQRIPPDGIGADWEIEDTIYENEAQVIMGGSAYSQGKEATCSTHNSFMSYEMGILNNSFRCCK